MSSSPRSPAWSRPLHRCPSRGRNHLRRLLTNIGASVVLWRRRTRPRSALASLREAFRPRAHHPFPQADARVDRAACQAPGTGGSVDLARACRLRATEAGSLVRGRPPSAMGASATTSAADTVQGPSGFRGTPGGGGHSGEGSETLRQVAGATQRKALRAGRAPPSAQEDRLSPRERPTAEPRDGLQSSRKILRG